MTSAPNADTKNMSKADKKKAKKAEQLAARTPEMTKALKEKKESKKAAKRLAAKELIEFIKTYGEEDIKRALAVLWPNAMGVRAAAHHAAVSRVTSGAILTSLFPNGVGSSVDELTVFQAVQLGRAEMRKHIVRAIKNAKNSADRVWVAFDFETKMYTFVGTGAKEPSGWVGYTPIEIDGAEIK